MTNNIGINKVDFHYILMKFWEYDKNLFDSDIFTLYYLAMGGRTYDYTEDLISYSNSKLLSPVSDITFINFAKTLMNFKQPINLNFEPIFITLSQILNIYLSSNKTVTIQGSIFNLSDLRGLLYLQNGECLIELIPYLAYLLTLYTSGSLVDFNSVDLNSPGPGKTIYSKFNELAYSIFDLYLTEKQISLADAHTNQEVFNILNTYLSKKVMRDCIGKILNLNVISEIISQAFSLYTNNSGRTYYEEKLKDQKDNMQTINYNQIFDMNITTIVLTILKNNYIVHLSKTLPMINENFDLSRLAEFITVYQNNISASHPVFLDLEHTTDNYENDTNLYYIMESTEESLLSFKYKSIKEVINYLERDKDIQAENSLACVYSKPQIWFGYLFTKIKEYYINGYMFDNLGIVKNSFTNDDKKLPTYNYTYQHTIYAELNSIIIYILNGLYLRKMNEYLARVKNLQDILSVPELIYRFKQLAIYDESINPFIYLTPSIILCSVPHILPFYVNYRESNDKQLINPYNPIQLYSIFQNMLNNTLFDNILQLNQFILWIQDNRKLINVIHTEFTQMKIKNVVIPCILEDQKAGLVCSCAGRLVYDDMKYNNAALRGCTYVKSIMGYNSNFKLLELLAKIDTSSLFSSINLYTDKTGISFEENIKIFNMLKTIYGVLQDKSKFHQIDNILLMSFKEEISYEYIDYNSLPMFQRDMELLSLYIPNTAKSFPQEKVNLTTICGAYNGEYNGAYNGGSFNWEGNFTNSMKINNSIVPVNLYEGNVRYEIPIYNFNTSLDLFDVAFHLNYDLFVTPLKLYRSNKFCIIYWVIFER